MSQNLPPWDSPEVHAARTPWTRVRHETVFENPWLRIESHDAIAPTGKPAHYGVVRFRNRAIAVLPLHDDGTVTLVGQMRYAIFGHSWEIPEGGVPDGEPLHTGAMRELTEETGLIAGEMFQILEMDMSNSVTDEVATCFLAMDLSQGETAPDETEQFEYARVPFSHLLKAVINGQVRDSLTVACALRVHHMAVTGALAPHLCEAVLRQG